MGDVKENQKVCLVTGAGRGIGRAIAIELAKNGHHVICVSKSETNCSSVANEILESGNSAEYMAVDVSDSHSIFEACKTFLGKYSAIDILINNAGITRDNLVLRMSDDDWKDVISVNLTSCFFWIKNLLHPMIKKRWGRIINISSVVGLIGNAGQANYSASKAGIVGLTKSVAREVASRGITVNAIAPGFIESSMTEKLSDDIKSEILKNIPAKKFGTPEDVAAAVGFLCSERARYINGHVLNVDGGMVA